MARALPQASDFFENSVLFLAYRCIFSMLTSAFLANAIQSHRKEAQKLCLLVNSDLRCCLKCLVSYGCLLFCCSFVVVEERLAKNSRL